MVHTSFRAIRPVEGGPGGLIEALFERLGPQGTLVMPSWPEDANEPYDPARSPVAADLGVVAREFAGLPGVRRTAHVQAFSASGPQAEFVLSDPLPLPPHIPASPVGRVYELDGQVLLIGVDHDADTTIHLAEVLAGVPYGLSKTCTAIVDGRIETVAYRENDHCCARFKLVDAWLRNTGEQREGVLGNAVARLVEARSVVSAVVPRLRGDPLLFLHDPSEGCEDCDEARASLSA